MKNTLFILSVISVCLTGCETIRNTIGLTPEEPDASTVRAHAPLDVPCVLRLPDPEPGKKRPQDITAKEKAAQIALGGATHQTSQSSPGAEALLREAGAQERDPTIRLKIQEDLENYPEHKKSLLERMGLSDGHRRSKGKVIDAVEEKKKWVKNEL